MAIDLADNLDALGLTWHDATKHRRTAKSLRGMAEEFMDAGNVARADFCRRVADECHSRARLIEKTLYPDYDEGQLPTW
jgi:hypothetical protein